MKPELKNKLKIYASMTAGVITCADSANAMPCSPGLYQYNYLDLDISSASTDHYVDAISGNFKFRNDRIITLGTCSYTFLGNTKVYGYNTDDLIMGSGTNISKIGALENIYHNDFYLNDGTLFNSNGGYDCSSNSFFNITGDWNDDEQMGYVAIRTYDEGCDYYYTGWLRVKSKRGSTELYVIDHFQSFTNSGNVITTPEFIAAKVKSSIQTDISNNTNGSDLKLDITVEHADEIGTSEYRIFIVKDADAASFDKTQAESNPNYTVLSTSSSTSYGITFQSNTTDSNGDFIIEDVLYRVCILSVADGIHATDNNFYKSSSFKLESPVIASSTASNINAQDISNNGDARDLQVKFNKSADEATVDEYRAFVVKDGTSFSKTIAESNNNYKTVSSSGLSQYTINYLATDTDTDGSVIIENQPYRVYVLSMADGTIATANSLSSASNKITLTNPIIASSSASNIIASDIANNKDGRDLKVEFNKAANESTLSEYRVLVCKYYNTFNLNDAINNNNYTVVSKSGDTKYIVNFLETTLDTDGDLIVEDVWYKVYVMSVADGVNANTNSLSNPSNNIKLTTPLGLKENTTNFSAFYKNNLLHINVDNTLVGADIEVVNLLGERVLSNKLNNANNQFTLNVANGIYVVIVRKDGAVMTKKIVVH